MDDRFNNGIIGCGIKIDGLSFHGLTCWHVFLLHAIKSPFITHEGDITANDFLILNKINQLDYPETLDADMGIKEWIWCRRRKSIKSLERMFVSVASWINIELSTPKLWKSATNTGASSSLPPILRTVASLATNSGESLAGAWDTRYAAAAWFDIAFAEANGSKFKLDDGEDLPSNTPDDDMIAFAEKTLTPHALAAWKLENQI